MGSPIKFREFRQYFESRGLFIERRKKHFCISGMVGNERCIYPFPVHNGEVLEIYFKEAKKRFGMK